MKSHFYPVILAGGRGTRFWPLSRKKRAKQLLALAGRQTMIQQTVRRLLPLASAANLWVISNRDLRAGILRQLPRLRRSQVLAEPVGRNTAPAIGLAAAILLRRDPAAVLGLFPSDHVIGDEKQYRQNLERAISIAAAGENIVTLGLRPHRPETGYGYIEAGAEAGEGERVPPEAPGPPDSRALGWRPRQDMLSPNPCKSSTGWEPCLRVRRFTEKPDHERAEQFLQAGHYYWNSGIFVWSAQTLVNALREHLPQTAAVLEKIAAAYGRPGFSAVFQRLYPKCENISVDYAVLERRSQKGERASNLFCLPSDFGWNDLGSWTALYEYRISNRSQRRDGSNIVEGTRSFTLGAEGNYIHAPGKFVAVVGVKDVVVVETPDALLVTTRQHAQDVGSVVKYLDEKKLTKLV